MCLFPKQIYKKGYYEQDNYRGYKGQAYEIVTYSKCGSCPQCVNEKANNWVVRNFYEAKKNKKKCFITLTYKETNNILVKKDLQDFMKRFRINLKRSGYEEKIRMFGAGEYGERFGRPHMHVIIYGWEDENAKYLGINGRKNIYYESEIVKKSWGLGRTSYQKFNLAEAPYIALYETAKDTFKRAYKLTREKVKYLEKESKKIKNISQRRNLQELLKEANEKLEDEKVKYLLIREFNTWSIALGWELFEKEFYNTKQKYVFEEYIENKIFATPSPWVKKLANAGNIEASEEMFRREREIEKSKNELEEQRKANLRNAEQIKKDRKKQYEENVEITKNGAKTIF